MVRQMVRQVYMQGRKVAEEEEEEDCRRHQRVEDDEKDARPPRRERSPAASTGNALVLHHAFLHTLPPQHFEPEEARAALVRFNEHTASSAVDFSSLLPPEILLLIFSSESLGPRDICSLAQVNSHVRSLVVCDEFETRIWKRLCALHFRIDEDAADPPVRLSCSRAHARNFIKKEKRKSGEDEDDGVWAMHTQMDG